LEFWKEVSLFGWCKKKAAIVFSSFLLVRVTPAVHTVAFIRKCGRLIDVSRNRVRVRRKRALVHLFGWCEGKGKSSCFHALTNIVISFQQRTLARHDICQRARCHAQGFADGDVSTAFISEHENELLKFKQLSDEQVSMMRRMRLMCRIL